MSITTPPDTAIENSMSSNQITRSRHGRRTAPTTTPPTRYDLQSNRLAPAERTFAEAQLKARQLDCAAILRFEGSTYSNELYDHHLEYCPHLLILMDHSRRNHETKEHRKDAQQRDLEAARAELRRLTDNDHNDILFWFRPYVDDEELDRLYQEDPVALMGFYHTVMRLNREDDAAKAAHAKEMQAMRKSQESSLAKVSSLQYEVNILETDRDFFIEDRDMWVRKFEDAAEACTMASQANTKRVEQHKHREAKLAAQVKQLQDSNKKLEQRVPCQASQIDSTLEGAKNALAAEKKRFAAVIKVQLAAFSTRYVDLEVSSDAQIKQLEGSALESIETQKALQEQVQTQAGQIEAFRRNETAFAAANSDLKGQLSAFSTRNTELEGLIKQQANAFDNASAASTDASRTIWDLQNTTAQQKTRITKLENVVKQRNLYAIKSHATIAQQETDIATSFTRNAELERYVEGLQTRNNKLVGHGKQQNTTHQTALKAASSLLAVVQGISEQREQERAALSARVEKLEQSNCDDLATSSTRIAAIENERDTLAARVEELEQATRDTLAATTARFASLDEALQNHRATSSDRAQEAEDAAREDRITAFAREQSLAEALNIARDDYAAASARELSLAGDLAISDACEADLQNALQAAQEVSAQQVVAAQQAGDAAVAASMQIASLQSMVDELRLALEHIALPASPLLEPTTSSADVCAYLEARLRELREHRAATGCEVEEEEAFLARALTSSNVLAHLQMRLNGLREQLLVEGEVHYDERVFLAHAFAMWRYEQE
jgi:hypothetical protein